MEAKNQEINIKVLPESAVLIKKMRLLKRLNRQQAALLFDFSYGLIEKLENGRGKISNERFLEFQRAYGFSDIEVQKLRSGKIEAPTDANCIRKKITTDKRLNKRFRQKHITRECKVLKEMRLMKNLSQTDASLICKTDRRTIGFIENGRVTLDDNRIREIVESYGFTMELFNQLLKVNPLKHEMAEQCHKIIDEIDENKLRVIMPMIESMAK